MNDIMELAGYAVEALKRSGAQHAQCLVKKQVVTEVNLEAGEYSLFRTFEKYHLELKGVAAQKAGEAAAAALNRETVDQAVADCAEAMKTAKPDEFEGVAELTENGSFSSGDLEPEQERFIGRLDELIEATAKDPQKEPITEFIAKHTRSDSVYLNTNGVRFDQKLGFYDFQRRRCATLDNPVYGIGDFDMPFDESIRKQEHKPLEGPFTGELLFNPRFAWLYWWLSIGGIFGQYRFMDEEKQGWKKLLGTRFANPILNVSHAALDSRMVPMTRFTRDGYRTENVCIVKNGVAENFLLPRKIALKNGLKPTFASVDEDENEHNPINLLIEPGDESVADIIKAIDRGLVIFDIRNSISHDYDAGDFSGIARSALLIEKGEVTRPVSAVINANFYELQKNITHISSEYRDSGNSIVPWISMGGALIQPN